MTTQNPFETAAKTLFGSTEKFTPAAAQEAFKPVVENLKAWSALAQAQAQAVQAAAAESIEALKSVKEPQAAFDALKASAEKGVALTVKHVQEATAVGVEQFKTGVDALQQRYPAPEAFARVGQGLKDAASKMESAVSSMLKTGADASATASKKTRNS